MSKELKFGDDYLYYGDDTAGWKTVGFDDPGTLTDAVSISWDISTIQTAFVTLGGNREMKAPTGMVSGQTYVLHVIQDGTGSRTLTWGANYVWPGGTAPTLTTTPNARDIFQFFSDGTYMYGSTIGLNFSVPSRILWQNDDNIIWQNGDYIAWG